MDGTWNVFQAARDNKVKRVIYASSCAVYGDGPGKKKNEKMDLNPISVYAESKKSAEAQADLFRRFFGLETVGLRYFNVFGPRQDAGSPYSGVISLFLRKFAQAQRPVIYGDGHQTRDFIYVKDIVKANLIAAAARPAVAAVYNAGTGRSVSLNEVVKILNKIFGLRLKPVYRKVRPGDIRYSQADISAISKLAFRPEWDFERAVRDMLCLVPGR